MMLSAKQENERTLARRLGLSDDEAADRLSQRVTITASRPAAIFAHDLKELLDRTLVVVESDGHPDVEITIGCSPITNASTKLVASADACSIRVERHPVQAEWCELPGLTRKIGACFVAGHVIAHAVGGSLLEHSGQAISFEFANLGLDPELLSRPIHLEDAVLVGAGGVANGFLWAVRELNIQGQLTIVDPKPVGSGNLNRCLYFSEDDLREPKAEVLASRAAFDGLSLIPIVGTFGDVLKSSLRVQLAITTVDSRRVRRSIQDGLPLAVVDASTTDISAVVTHSHRQPTDDACLACIYAHIPLENERERDIAAGLGISVEDAKSQFITKDIAAKIAANSTDLNAAELEGLSLDSFYKAKCAEGALRTSAGEQALAPFAFISNLAGALQALELAKLMADQATSGRPNYLHLDPWRSPHSRLRCVRGRNPKCHFCSQEDSVQTLRDVWHDKLTG